MRKLLNRPWVVALLACSAVGLVAYEGLGWSTGREAAGTNVAVEPTAALESGEKAPENTADRLSAPEMFLTAGARDPFGARAKPVAAVEKPADAASDISQTLKLAAVWLQGAESFVAINAQIFRVGDAIAGASIESVTREGAWLRLPSGRQFLPVGREVTFAAPQKRALASTLAVSRER